MSKHLTIAENLEASGVSRRSFLQLCSVLMATAPFGLALTGKKSLLQVAEAIGKTQAAVCDLAAFPGLHRMHRDSVAYLRSRCGAFDP